MTRNPTNSFMVRVPGSTSNLGPGFDTLSVALSLFLQVTVEPLETAQLEWRGDWPTGDRNVFQEALNRTAERFGFQPSGLCFTARNEVPLQRGLGSSAAAITGGIVTACHLAGLEIQTAEFLEIAMPLEGHPDNLAASWSGGWVLSWQEGAETRLESLSVSLPLRFVMAIPEVKISTAKARQVLPQEYSRKDLVYSVQRSALLLHALYRDERKLLQAALQDRIHQPYRIPLIPGAAEILARQDLPRALSEHHLGAYLSGSGSTICSLTDQPEAAGKIGAWMVTRFEEAGVAADYRILAVSPEGARVEAVRSQK